MPSSNPDIKKDFERSFYFLLREEITLRNFLYDVFTCGTAYIVGGYIRDFLNGNKSRDIDIIVDIHQHELLNIVQALNCKYELNRHGGIKLKLDFLDVDVWNLENNWAIKNNLVHLNEQDLLNSIAKGCFYNYDSLVINVNNFSYNIRYYQDFLNTRRLDILQKSPAYKNLNPTVEANVIRALFLHANFNCTFSDNTNYYLMQRLAILKKEYGNELEPLLAVKSKYSKYDSLSSEALASIIAKLRNGDLSDNQILMDI